MKKNFMAQPVCVNNGFITLAAVMAAGAVSLSIGVSVILLGLGASRTGFDFEGSKQALGFAHACAEEALYRVRTANVFSENGSLAFGAGECSYKIRAEGAQGRLIEASGQARTASAKIKIVLSGTRPKIIIDSWQEVPDF